MRGEFSLFLIGVSGSGKTTIARQLLDKLRKNNVKVEFIDGDVLRSELGNLFGYTRDERMKNSHVVRTLAKYLNKNGVNTINAIVGPYEEMRSEWRDYLGKSYIEVYVQCSLQECIKRDVKGYYKKANAGEMPNLNGANDIFEQPVNSDIIVNTENNSVEACANAIYDYLQEKGYVL